ncbi:uncharacterized protein LOC112540981 [Python bivittatus]|uniref:Uncharacterized protein LOC112540981 n=1 Tax=Python bivittatus TaxID=176946 RepID=A0A9F5IZE1_PYTBI|nr:uncharacterized protein LOC112540981 [Python bivittatus]
MAAARPEGRRGKQRGERGSASAPSSACPSRHLQPLGGNGRPTGAFPGPRRSVRGAKQLQRGPGRPLARRGGRRRAERRCRLGRPGGAKLRNPREKGGARALAGFSTLEESSSRTQEFNPPRFFLCKHGGHRPFASVLVGELAFPPPRAGFPAGQDQVAPVRCAGLLIPLYPGSWALGHAGNYSPNIWRISGRGRLPFELQNSTKQLQNFRGRYGELKMAL